MDSREPSAAPSSGGDTVDDQPEDVKPTITEVDNDESRASPLPAVGTPSSVRSTKRGKGSIVRKPRPKKGTHVWINEGPGEGTEDESAHTPTSRLKKSGSPDADGRTQGTAVGTRRQANGVIGSVYSGSKVRHLKKPDGTPFWRSEIQYEFLRLVIENTQPVFTRVGDKRTGCNFADIYIDCMGRSSKTSKVLKDRLQVDRQAAQNMGMICLLVNVGRMNTTLNFFPEMRAQLRTYHSIPSLQAYESQKDYKSLQDAPRLKSILKGASEDTDEPRTLAAVKAAAIPRTNPVNLIFVLSQSAPEVAQLHFTDKVDFHDLFIRTTISSETRARAFLWLMWWYLEAPVHDRQTALNNPFGPGEFKETQDPNDPTEVPQQIPKLVTITEEEAERENEDPEEEKKFAERKQRERKRLMIEVAAAEADGSKEIEHKGVKRLKKTARDSDDDSDSTSMRASPGVRRSPAVEAGMGMMSSNLVSGMGQAESLDDDWEPVDQHPGRGRYKRVKGKNTPSRGKGRLSEVVGSTKRAGGRSSMLAFDRGTPDTVAARGTPQPLLPGVSGHQSISQYSVRRGDADSLSMVPKSRARTGYQRQLEEHRNSRIEWLLKKKRRDMLKEARERRSQNHWIRRVATRIQDLDLTYDSEEDEEGSGLFGHLSSSLPNANGNHQNSSALAAQGPTGIGMGGLVVRRALVAPTRKANGASDGDRLDLLSQQANIEEDDFGEEAENWLKVLKRTRRRLQTWSGERDYEIYLARKAGKKIPVSGVPASTKSKEAAAEAAAAAAAAHAAFVMASRRSHTTAKSGARSSGRGGARRSGIGTGRAGGRMSTAARARSSAANRDISLNDEITQDLLAERSDDEDQDADDADADGDGDVDGDGDLENDGDVAMEDGANDDIDGNEDADADADGDGDGDADEDRDEDSDIDMD